MTRINASYKIDPNEENEIAGQLGCAIACITGCLLSAEVGTLVASLVGFI